MRDSLRHWSTTHLPAPEPRHRLQVDGRLSPVPLDPTTAAQAAAYLRTHGHDVVIVDWSKTDSDGTERRHLHAV